jgi:hypothetical protein
MARFRGEYQESFLLIVPAERAKAHFGSLDQIVRHQSDIERVVRIDDQTLHFYLRPRSAQGVTFKGEYRCRYAFTTPDLLEWRTIGEGNMWLEGSARFHALDVARTRIDFIERIETEIEVNRVLAALIKPIVQMEMRQGVRRYLERARRSLEGG